MLPTVVVSLERQHVAAVEVGQAVDAPQIFGFARDADRLLGLGQRGYSTLIHEIGHALNLEDRDTTDPAAPSVLSGSGAHRVTVMATSSSSIDARYGSSPLLLDIAALQERYFNGSGEAQRDQTFGIQSSAGDNTYFFEKWCRVCEFRSLPHCPR